MKKKSEIVIYKTKGGNKSIEVALQNETVWLTQKQIALLFGTEVPAISKHISNIFKSKELPKKSTVSKMETVQKEGNRLISRTLDHYNLDMVISVGYRINSKRGTQFRIWATNVLKDYIIHSQNQKHQKELNQLKEFKQLIQLEKKVTEKYPLKTDEAIGLIRIIAEYSYALDTLDDYDHQRLQLPKKSKIAVKISYEEARKAIDALGRQSSFKGLFGKEKDDSFKGSLENIYQTFSKKELYPSTEEKAAHLLYFVTKNHSFTDGNKRIAAFLFIWFLERNNLLHNKFGEKVLPDKALVALTLMIAESNPNDKDMMIKLIVNLIKP